MCGPRQGDTDLLRSAVLPTFADALLPRHVRRRGLGLDSISPAAKFAGTTSGVRRLSRRRRARPAGLQSAPQIQSRIDHDLDVDDVHDVVGIQIANRLSDAKPLVDNGLHVEHGEVPILVHIARAE